MRSNKEIIDLIILIAKKRKLSFSELARRTGISRSTMSRYRNGSRDFPIDRVNTFAKVLHVRPEYLLGIFGTKRRLIMEEHFEQLTQDKKERVGKFINALLDEQEIEDKINRYKSKYKGMQSKE